MWLNVKCRFYLTFLWSWQHYHSQITESKILPFFLFSTCFNNSRFKKLSRDHEILWHMDSKFLVILSFFDIRHLLISIPYVFNNSIFSKHYLGMNSFYIFQIILFLNTIGILQVCQDSPSPSGNNCTGLHTVRSP